MEGVEKIVISRDVVENKGIPLIVHSERKEEAKPTAS